MSINVLNKHKKYESLSLAYFGHNRDDIAFIRRIDSLMKAGVNLTSFTFRRDERKNNSSSYWPNNDLGYVEHANFGKRLLLMLKTILTIIQNRKVIYHADIVYARNLDMFLLAWVAKVLVPFHSCILVYECLDVHEIMTGKTILSKVLRWVERQVLKRADLLVISSPGFMDNYFLPIQHFTGNHFLVENKVHIEPIFRPKPVFNIRNDAPLKLVWAGILRCQKTLDLLKDVAKALPGKIEIHLWGKISAFIIPDFLEQIEGVENITFHGSYQWPDQLEEVYKDADFSWSQELSWSGFNSDWLLPNRIYEASYFSTLSLAVNGTQTAEYVHDHNIGHVFPTSDCPLVIDYFQTIDRVHLNNLRLQLFNQDVDNFVVSEEDTRQLIEAMVNSTFNSALSK